MEIKHFPTISTWLVDYMRWEVIMRPGSLSEDVVSTTLGRPRLEQIDGTPKAKSWKRLRS